MRFVRQGPRIATVVALTLVPLSVVRLAGAEEPVVGALGAPARDGSSRPPPVRVAYAQYGAALSAGFKLTPGGSCGPLVRPPCIVGSGGGLVLRGGYRARAPFYVGGAYEVTRMTSGNLYRLGTFQQLRAEFRYVPDLGYRIRPYLAVAVGGVLYGNEWGAETGGGVASVGVGMEIEVSRLAVVGLALHYRPVVLAGWTDTAAIVRPLGVTHFLAVEVSLDARTDLGRR